LRRLHPSRRTCIHEAGHAVIGVVLRVGVLSVCACAYPRKSPELDDDEWYEGWFLFRCQRYGDHRTKRYRDYRVRRATTLLAGRIAEKGRQADTREQWEARYLLECPKRNMPSYRQCVARASLLVKAHRRAINAVARTLRQRHRLTGAQVRRIVVEVEKGPRR
jgi:hypothetical protein